MTLPHARVLLEAFSLEIDILSSIMLLKNKFFFDADFFWCSRVGIFHVEKSPFTERGGVSAFVREAKKKKPRKQWMKKFNGRLVEAEVQKKTPGTASAFTGRACKKMCAFIHACFFSPTGAWWPETLPKKIVSLASFGGAAHWRDLFLGYIRHERSHTSRLVCWQGLRSGISR